MARSLGNKVKIDFLTSVVETSQQVECPRVGWPSKDTRTPTATVSLGDGWRITTTYKEFITDANWKGAVRQFDSIAVDSRWDER